MNSKKLLTIAAGIGAIYLGVKYFGNSEEEITTNNNNLDENDSQDCTDDEIYKRIQIDRKKYCDNVKNESNFLKKIYSGMRFNPRFDLDIFDVIKAYNSDYTIAITEGEEPETTDIQCRFVNITKTDRNSPKVPDYIRCINNSVKEVSYTWNRKLIKNQRLLMYFFFFFSSSLSLSLCLSSFLSVFFFCFCFFISKNIFAYLS